MPNQLICQNGHQWDLDGVTQIDPANTFCMICAAPAQLVTDTTRHVTIVAVDRPPEFMEAAELALPIVPGYEIKRRLGQGGMGDVYLARQAITERLVAIKIPKLSSDLSTKARFRGEAEAAAKLHHSGIVQIYEVGDSPSGLFLVMEFCAGGSLLERLKGSPLPFRTAAKIMVQLARAIHAAHQAGIVHRDLKPGNILLSAHGDLPSEELGLDPANWTLKVADFGLARQMDSETDWTKTGAVLGTPSYMSPEQASGLSKAVGPRADTYSLGAILYELLTGRPPFRGASTIETLDQVRNHEPVPPTRIQPTIPRNVETICLKCLQKAPTKRYATARDLADDLERFLEGRPILARPATRLEHAAKWARRNPYVAALATLLSVAIVTLMIGGVIYHFRLSSQRDRAVANLGLAMRSVDRMLTQVADEDLANEPRFEKKRRALLEEALTLYQELLRVEGRNPNISEQTGLAAKRVGDIQRLLGQYDSSHGSYSQALGYLIPLRDTSPSRQELARSVAECHNGIGEDHRLRSHPEAAAVAYRQATEILLAILADNPSDVASRKELARARYNLGIVYKDLNRLDESQKEYEEAIELMRVLDGEEVGQKWHLARSLLNLGIVHRLKNQSVPADDRYREAIQHYEELTISEPQRQDFQHELAVCLMNRANLHTHDSDANLRSGSLLRSRDILTRLVSDFPATPIYRADLANCCLTLAGTAFARRDWPDVERRIEESVTHNRKLIALDPNHVDYHARLGVALGNLGRVRLIRADRATALAAVTGSFSIHTSAVRDHADIRETLEHGLEEVAIALKSNPDQPEYHSSFRQQCLDLAKILGRSGEIEVALRRADSLTTELPGGRFGVKYAAIFLARHAFHTPTEFQSSSMQRSRRRLEDILSQPNALTADEKQKLLLDPALLPLSLEKEIIAYLKK